MHNGTVSMTAVQCIVNPS